MASSKQKNSQNQKKSNQASAKKEEEQNKRTILIALIILLLLFLLGWWMAANHWGPWSTPAPKDTTSQGAGSNTSGGSATNQNTGSDTTSGGSTSGGTGAAGTNGTNGSNGSNGTNGTTTTPPAAENTDAIVSLSGSVNNGQTKDEVTAKAGGTNQTCTITANSTTVGKQEVCTYSQGSKVVTVTYLNDHVVNVSRSGF